MEHDDELRYVNVLRRCIPGLAASEPVLADAVLVDLGLDSLGRMRLLVALEKEFDIVFPDELLVPETFNTVTSLQAALTTVLREMVR
ncbi:phosphopantetheine-binding protein [Streptomyces sp. NEAU-Y11]|uniref:phosphopantetheine-binding protein n=1 Tax=Streptomyces cucumeris TaxID=2962890 RepID=UPI0020C925B0|nr:phosphopantetheine-binding protein [Streptomyces sp. NEAU-Y11]MCP9211170.1 phosphopantetheine-binding protein [Streptomyces sp. NEAU-Y11]